MLRHYRYSCKQPVELHLDPCSLPLVASRLVAVENYISSLKKSRVTATPTIIMSFLQTNDAAAHLLVHAENFRRSAHAALAIHSHRSHVMGRDDEFSSAISVTVVARFSSCCAPSRSASTPLLLGKYFLSFFFLLFFLHKLVSSNSSPRSCLSFGLARRVRLSHSATVLQQVRTVWRVGLATLYRQRNRVHC